jgi:hypothetical protein
MAVVSPRHGDGPVRGRVWRWLTACAAEGCDERSAHLGWCARHAPDPDGAVVDEYWGGPGHAPH